MAVKTKARRSKAEVAREALLRKLVDPATFKTPLVMDVDATGFSAKDLTELLNGLSVRIRSASRGVVVPKHRGPGPGEYSVPPIATSSGPRWASDIAVTSQVDRDAKALPSPLDYHPVKPQSARSVRLVSRLADVELAPAFPGPGTYLPAPPKTTKRYTFSPISQTLPNDIINPRPAPNQYCTPSLFDPKPGSSAQKSSRWARDIRTSGGPGQYRISGIEPRQMSFSPTRRQFH